MNCLCSSTRHAARMLTHHYETELGGIGITSAQFELLSVLHSRPGLHQAKLVELLHIDQTTLSRNLQVLKDRAWVSRNSAKQDRRQSSWSLTAQGLAVWRKAHPRWERAQARMQEILGDDWQLIWNALDRLIGTLTKIDEV